ncbi:uncharacterized protein LOC110811246 isoform X2 [Carica papaya]|uniref:uncharacterized protein LOC110811246 isoform X2 n=1 Tax=Carica papaya TaxID=3649 RepID=UPI000B8C709D|nr:uncharacterized protein LOC110811246 isoform X2 [Carica papaya]
MKCQKVEETFGPQLEYEPIEVEHILAEPETDKFSVDDILCFGKEDTRKSSVLEEIFHGFDYGFTGKCGGLESNNICGGEYDSKLEEFVKGSTNAKIIPFSEVYQRRKRVGV